jgi:hypothetical protein
LSKVDEAIDARGIPTAVCPLCGSDWFYVPVKFNLETHKISAWGPDGYCYSCSSKVTVVTPVDGEVLLDEDEDDNNE